MLLHCLRNALGIDDIGKGTWTALQQLALRLCARDVACHNVLVTVKISKVHGQLRTNLSC